LIKRIDKIKINEKSYTFEIYEGAGHAFMRRGDDPNGTQENIEARNKSWERLKKILKD
jgi:carboxymethylenebutenolidase